MKSTITFTNPTTYFHPDYSAGSVTIQNPALYFSDTTKQQGYETRLYFEYEGTKAKGGDSYFYTLTYNNAALPHYIPALNSVVRGSQLGGIPCFDYEDIRYITHGGLDKKLLRNFGTKMKYFVGCELGEGKGSRGAGNNPHYHVLFFLTNAEDERYPYHRILPEQFETLIKTYWQGTSEKIDYSKAKFGIARPGNNLGLLDGFAGTLYCAKYVCKDASVKNLERKVYAQLSSILTDENNRKPIEKRLTPSELEKEIRSRLTDFRNRYSAKVRISNGVGNYAFIHPSFREDTFSVSMPHKNGFKRKKLGLYYFRKYFTDIVYDKNKSPRRVLNQRGIEYRIDHLGEGLEKKAKTTYKCVQFYLKNSEYRDKYMKSPHRTVEPKYTVKELERLLSIDNNDIINSMYYDYAMYKNIYEHHYYYEYTRELDPMEDYRRFLTSTFGVDGLTTVDKTALPSGYYSYSRHPFFNECTDLFSLLDDLVSFYFVELSEKTQKDYEERKRTKNMYRDLKLRKEGLFAV
ncbi:replication initiator protein [Capybara microvirus Cap1_SP_107]|nr:replication initiator protein [Capybara microvirus Cap1_SP_107]